MKEEEMLLLLEQAIKDAEDRNSDDTIQYLSFQNTLFNAYQEDRMTLPSENLLML